ncbi:MAG: DinB family protein, partial [Acidimicrobiia bacterium]|nr:DinB family protein [Acidimicrobiia bacterium]
PTTADEFTTLTSFLDYFREVVVHKLEGVEESALRAVLVPSRLTTLGGIIRHLGFVERWWFQSVYAGRELDYPWSKEAPDAEFLVPDGASADSLIAFYRDCCAESRRVVEESPDLDRVVRAGSREVSLRWILVHMIEETARHAGHLDLLRESWDGAVGD